MVPAETKQSLYEIVAHFASGKYRRGSDQVGSLTGQHAALYRDLLDVVDRLVDDVIDDAVSRKEGR